MSETQCCIIVVETTENLLTHSYDISLTIAKSYEYLLKFVVGLFQVENESSSLQTVTYKVNDTNMFAFITLLQDFRNNGWVVISSNAYTDFASQQLFKNFYFEKIVRRSEATTLSPPRVCMSDISDNKQKEHLVAGIQSLLETPSVVSRSVAAPIASSITSPVRRLSQLGRDDKYYTSSMEAENPEAKQTFVQSSSISSAASTEKASSMPPPASKPKSLLEARRASLGEKTRSPSFTSEGLKILNDYSNKIAVELDRNEIMGTVVSNAVKAHTRPPPPPVPVAGDVDTRTQLQSTSTSISLSSTEVKTNIPAVEIKPQAVDVSSPSFTAPHQPLSPSPESIKDLYPMADTYSTFSPTSTSSSSSLSPAPPAAVSSLSTPVPASTPRAPFSMTKSPVFSKLTPKFVHNTDENEEIKKKNENFFKKMVEEEEIQKLSKIDLESKLDPDELMKLRAHEKEKEDHESMKAAHFKRLGAATVVSRGGTLMSTGRGRGFSSKR